MAKLPKPPFLKILLEMSLVLHTGFVLYESRKSCSPKVYWLGIELMREEDKFNVKKCLRTIILGAATFRIGYTGTREGAAGEALRIAALISAPILVAALVTGVSIGLFQALTSIQEMTITFVPKLMAMMAVFWMTMNFMTRSLTDFFAFTIIPTIAGG